MRFLGLRGISTGAACSLLLGIAGGTTSASGAVITQLTSPSQITLGCLNTFELNKTDCATFDATTFLGLATSWTSGVTPSGVQGLVEGLSNEPLGASFPSSNAVGMYFGNDDFGLSFPVKLSVFDSGSVLLGSVFVTSNANDFADQFIGLSSDTAFTRAEISYARPAAAGLSDYIDDFRIGTAAASTVPEPATLVLFGAGLFGLGALRRKAKA